MELTTELIIQRALQMGITIADFEILTVGMIVDLAITLNGQETCEDNEVVRPATQEDYDSF